MTIAANGVVQVRLLDDRDERQDWRGRHVMGLRIDGLGVLQAVLLALLRDLLLATMARWHFRSRCGQHGRPPRSQGGAGVQSNCKLHEEQRADTEPSDECSLWTLHSV